MARIPEKVITLKDGVVVSADTDNGIWVHLPESQTWAFITYGQLARFASQDKPIENYANNADYD